MSGQPDVSSDLLSDTFDLEVDVTQRHIDSGAPGSCELCPIALAVVDALRARQVPLRDGAPVVVEYSYALFFLAACRSYMASMPVEVRDFIEHYDADLVSVAGPFPFTLHFQLRPELFS